ncbi:hypothetical protein E5206_09330 [Arthrobacter sp. PAMC25564]|uniref:hypothetical protein n=1 Tax=Arthrobacter sp. PAMC25564 TaxID=2565366 RepID=UPI0010A2307C|nr:hypothetical protein [Arthrobacter sp. PAMC25564]QCB97105.1 hypothetical protein E5206_09330 [Arthrobacter sp. PAMC25564]
MKPICGAASGALLAIALAGCSSAAAATDQTGTASSTPAPKPTTYFGQTASAIAALVPGCSAIQAGDVGQGGPGMASTASCVIGGRTVDFYSWSDANASAEVAGVVRADEDEVYYAAGAGWTAHVRRDMTFHWQLTNDAGNLTQYAVEDHVDPIPDLPGEKLTSEQIAAALAGSVEHIS